MKATFDELCTVLEPIYAAWDETDQIVRALREWSRASTRSFYAKDLRVLKAWADENNDTLDAARLAVLNAAGWSLDEYYEAKELARDSWLLA